MNGASFVQLNEQSLLLNFPKLNFGQRTACLDAVYDITSSKNKFIFKDPIVTSVCNNTLILEAEADNSSSIQLDGEIYLSLDDDELVKLLL